MISSSSACRSTTLATGTSPSAPSSAELSAGTTCVTVGSPLTELWGGSSDSGCGKGGGGWGSVDGSWTWGGGPAVGCSGLGEGGLRAEPS